MPNVQVRVKGGPTAELALDRVPVMRDYITANGTDIFRVEAVVLTSGHPTIAAIVFATHDADGVPDEIKDMIPPVQTA